MIIEIKYPGDKYEDYNEYMRDVVQARIKKFVGVKGMFKLLWISPNHIIIVSDDGNKKIELLRCLSNTFCKAEIEILKQ